MEHYPRHTQKDPAHMKNQNIIRAQGRDHLYPMFYDTVDTLNSGYSMDARSLLIYTSTLNDGAQIVTEEWIRKRVTYFEHNSIFTGNLSSSRVYSTLHRY